MVAQCGKYGPGATSLNDFIVEGEARYWVYVAIDRFTGKLSHGNSNQFLNDERLFLHCLSARMAVFRRKRSDTGALRPIPCRFCTAA